MTSLNKPSEFADAAFDLSGQQDEKKVQWHPFGDAGFVNAYCEVKAHILIRFRIGDGQEFLACVQRDWKPIFRSELESSLSPTGEGKRQVTWAERVLNRQFLWREVMHEVYGANGQEQSVLVNVVEPMEGPERVIPSVVWLDTVERFERLLLNAGYDSSQRGYVVLGRMSDWELCIFSDDGNYPTREVIESAAKTAQNIASDKRYVIRDRGNLADAIREFSSFRIYLSERRNWVRFVEDSKSGKEFLEVLFGPIQLV